MFSRNRFARLGFCAAGAIAIAWRLTRLLVPSIAFGPEVLPFLAVTAVPAILVHMVLIALVWWATAGHSDVATV